MILSVSRRTDIPCRYSEWFMNRIREGFAVVRNPFNAGQLSRIPMTPEVVDCIVFWTKDPQPLMPYLKELDSRGYRYYFQFTLTPYSKALEPGLRDKKEIIRTFRSLAEQIGSSRIIWRYDPVVLNETMGIEYHRKAFRQLCCELQGCMRSVTVSFVDRYTGNGYWQEPGKPEPAWNYGNPGKPDPVSTSGNPGKTEPAGDTGNPENPENPVKAEAGKKNLLRDTAEEEMEELAAFFARTGAEYGLQVNACCEAKDLTAFGVGRASCIDRAVIEDILGGTVRLKPDKGQRKGCGCYESIDIGAYNTCPNGCIYCYANHSPRSLEANLRQTDKNSEMLVGHIREGDKVTERKAVSCFDGQCTLKL
ncbi:DUF1848 domain-containing protein [Eisenbergiella sp.]